MISEISKIICKQDHYSPSLPLSLSPSLPLSLSPLPPPLSPSLSLSFTKRVGRALRRALCLLNHNLNFAAFART